MAAPRRSLVDIIGPNGVSAFAAGNTVIGPFPVTFEQGVLYIDPDSKDAVLVNSAGEVCEFFLDDQSKLVFEMFEATIEREDGLGCLTI